MKYDFQIHYREINIHSGNWNDWIKGFGIWQSTDEAKRLEQLSKTVKLLFAIPKTIEIKIIRNGEIIDYKGNIIGKSMIYEKK
jgi:hypothetical protein